VLTTWHRLSVKVGISVADKRRSLSRYSSLTDSGHAFCLIIVHNYIPTARALAVLYTHMYLLPTAIGPMPGGSVT
jgi:hypothetical protein